MRNIKTYINWYNTPEYQTFIKELIQDTNKQSEGYYTSDIQWMDSTYHNDVCGSICFDLDENGETYVQMWAFHNNEEAKREGFEEKYSIVTYENGDEKEDSHLVTNNRQEAIAYALESVSTLVNNEEFWNSLCRNGKPMTQCECC
tara:strand:+ start:424 stop:858 length:435 start_codon:yes stop_codon:yes gene_type:complete